MAFRSKDLSVLAYANGFTLWHYTTEDNSHDLSSAGYFNGASDLLRVGDMMLTNTKASGNVEGGMFVVSSNSAGQVTVVGFAMIPGGVGAAAANAA